MRLKTIYEQIKHSDDHNGAIKISNKDIESLIASLGIDDAEFIGYGAESTAYDLNNGTILKFANHYDNKSLIKKESKAKESKLRHIVKVHDVGEFHGEGGKIGYAIEDKITSLEFIPDEEMSMWEMKYQIGKGLAKATTNRVVKAWKTDDIDPVVCATITVMNDQVDFVRSAAKDLKRYDKLIALAKDIVEYHKDSKAQNWDATIFNIGMDKEGEYILFDV